MSSPTGNARSVELTVSNQRSYPPPTRRWLLRQTWNDLAFLHWLVPAEVLRRKIPPRLTLDEWNGQCWVGVVPFWISGIGLRVGPTLPGLDRVPEINVRTYVRYDDKPGVWFFSLDIANLLGVLGGRGYYRLPYFAAKMEVTPQGNAVEFRSHRIQSERGADFDATYEPRGEPTVALPGTLDHWLTARYCLYAQGLTGAMFRAEIDHPPWPLQPGSVTLRKNQMAKAVGIELPPEPPLVHFAKRLSVVIWSPDKL